MDLSETDNEDLWRMKLLQDLAFGITGVEPLSHTPNYFNLQINERNNIINRIGTRHDILAGGLAHLKSVACSHQKKR